MKIFTLESKLTLVLWSLVLGIILNLVSIFATENIQNGFGGSLKMIEKWGGIPYQFLISRRAVCDVTDGCRIFDKSEWIFVLNMHKIILTDFIFWIIIGFVILSIIRNFRKKNDQLK